MPILAHPEYTRAAIADVLAQSIPTRLLLINQGVDDPFREELEKIAEEHDDRVLLWSHQPPLPSLAATWNQALYFVWAAGGSEALVVNNDVRLARQTIEALRAVLTYEQALFVSCVGVTSEQYTGDLPPLYTWTGWLQPTEAPPDRPSIAGKGGPDFSCFLISRQCHDLFRFDEAFTPAFCEDLDYHRRLLLAGEGARIFSVNLPYLHYGSATLKTVEPRERMKIDRAIEQGSRAYYRRKWGGAVNQERWIVPFNTLPTLISHGDVTTPTLQRLLQEGKEDELPKVLIEYLGQQGDYQPPAPQGILDDGLDVTSGPDDGYRGVPRGQVS
jgi:hypothetical protein